VATKLVKYNEKRDFARTPEPAGEEAASGREIFMVQKHAATRLHWDFRLELDGVLLSWAVTRGPSADPDDKRLAVRTEDHPLTYATFEGTIPKGQYGGGTVMLWDRGTWTPHPGKDPVKTLAEGHLHFTLDGERMRGEWIMVRLKPRPKEKQESWLLRKVADSDAGGDLAAEHMTSVASGRTMEEIAAGATPHPGAHATVPLPQGERGSLPSPLEGEGDASVASEGEGSPPAFRAPMLATLTDAPPAGNDWLHEVKFDGYRLLVALGGGKVECWTRNGNVFAPPSLGPLADELLRLPIKSALLDGEVCVLDHHGRPHFSLLKNSLKERSSPLDLFVFDALEVDGEDLTGLPLTDRKARLQALLKPLKPPVHYTDHVRGEGERVLSALCAKDFEGIISKRADSRYLIGKRGPAWLKIKCGHRQEFVIGGWSRSDKGRGFASLLLGYMKDGALIYAGRVGTGFDTAEIARLTERMAAMTLPEAPFAEVPREAKRGATWVRPELVCEVAYTEFTPDNHLRHPSYLGLREDKAAADVVLEVALPAPNTAPPPSPTAPPPPKREEGASPPPQGEVGAKRTEGEWGARHGVTLTNPDRVIFPEAGITKAMLADYYEAVAPLIIAEIADRPLSLVRCPQGRGKQCFFQKHDSGMFSDAVKRVDLHEITSEGAERQPYLYVEDIAGVLSTVQMGALELHIWGAKVPREDLPDRLVFDLDPDEGLGFPAVIEGALDLRARLKVRGLESWPMLSGGKGVHVIVPIAPEHAWDVVKPWTHRFALAAAAERPERYTATLAKKARGGKIFIDYLRNGRGATAIAPYSTRAREGAPVAAPIAWKELAGFTTGAAFGVRDAAALVKRAANNSAASVGAAAATAARHPSGVAASAAGEIAAIATAPRATPARSSSRANSATARVEYSSAQSTAPARNSASAAASSGVGSAA